MNRAGMNKQRLSVQNILFKSVGALFVLTMLSVWLVCGMYAKYVISDLRYDSARVAGFGGVLELWEHQADETATNSGIYGLTKDTDHEVKGNTYAKVLPGVDIPKDPFIVLELNSDLSFELYIRVTEENFPTDTYEDANGNTYRTAEYYMEDCWKLFAAEDDGSKVYQYVDPTTKEPFVFQAAQEYDRTNRTRGASDSVIWILKDDTVFISEHYVGDDDFSLTFEAWLKQVGTN